MPIPFIVAGISAIAGLASSIIAGCSAVSGVVATFATKLFSPLVFSNLKLFLNIIDIVSVISEVLGLKNKEEKIEEVGFKIEEASKKDIKPENFDSYEKYIDNVKESIEVDKAKIENLNDEDKAKYMAIGCSVLVKGIEEKEKINIPPEFILEVAKQELKADDVREYMKVFKTEGLELKDFSKYFNGTLENNRFESVGNAIESAIKNINPEMTLEQIDDKMSSMSEKSKE